MPAQILVVEDDPAIVSILEAAMEYGGYESRSANGGAAAVQMPQAQSFDAILLDLGLPDFDGRELLQIIRKTTTVPIIVVSGRADERDKIEALDLGADDYIPKPFLPGELLARLRAALRRNQPSQRENAPPASSPEMPMEARQPEMLTLEHQTRSAHLLQRRAIFTEPEFKVLAELAEHPGEVVSKNSLLRVLYGANPPAETKIVEVYVSAIRKKLREISEGQDLIDNFRGRGWSLVHYQK